MENKSTTISMIACIDDNNAIGNKNDLLFKNKEDMQFFKEHTLNKVVVMGRATYESIGKPLTSRVNVVLTTDKDYIPHPDIIVKHSITSVLEDFGDQDELVIIGGETIYEQFLPYATRLYLTRVHHEFTEVDTYFPTIFEVNLKEIYFKEGKTKSKYPFTFHIYNLEKNKEM